MQYACMYIIIIMYYELILTELVDVYDQYIAIAVGRQH